MHCLHLVPSFRGRFTYKRIGGGRSGSNRSHRASCPRTGPAELTATPTRARTLDSTVGVQPTRAYATGFAARHLRPLGHVEKNRFRSRVPEPPNHCGRFTSRGESARLGFIGVVRGIRTRVAGLKSRRPDQVDEHDRQLPLRLCPRASHPVGCGVSLHEVGCPAAHIPRRVHLEVARRRSAGAHPK